MGDNIKKIKDLTKSLTEDATQLAKQAEAGFKSQWMSVDDRGEAKWGGTPGIYYGTVGLPALADLAKEGTAPDWAKEADEKAAKIREAVERKMRIEEPKGFPQHLARAAGEMVAQIPVPGAWMNKLRTAKLAVNEAPSLKRKIALSPIEYFSPIVEVGKAKPTAINYGVGTLFGGGLGYGIEKLTEEKPTLRDMLDKYGPNYGSEVRDVSKPQKYSKGGDVEDNELVYAPKENLIFVGQEHGKNVNLSPKIKELIDKYGAYYEGSGGDKVSDIEYKGSWDDAASKSIKGYPEEFLYTLFTNTDVNKQEEFLKGEGSIFDNILKNQKKVGYFKDKQFDEKTLRSFLEQMGDSILDFSRKDASEENVREFLRAGENMMWNHDDTNARHMANKVNELRQEWLLSQPSGVFFVGSDHIKDLKKKYKPKQFSKGGDVEDKQELSKLQELTAKYAYDVEKQRKYNTGKYSGKEDEVVKPRRYFNEKLVDIPGDFKSNTIKTPLGDRVIEMYKQFNMPEYREEDVPLKKHLRYYAGGGKAQKLKQGRSAFFSAVDNAISTLKQEKGTPEQMYSLIEKTPGVKKEELERRGIKKKLQGKKSVTKAELETIAKENPAQAPIITRLKDRYTLEDIMGKLKDDTGLDDLAIQNIETKLGLKFDYSPTFGLRVKDLEGSLYNLNDLEKIVKDYRYANDISETEAKDLLNDINKIDPYFDPLPDPKYPNYALKGLANKPVDYQEVIMSMPTRMQQLREFAKQRGITNIQEAERAWEQEYGQLLPEDEYVGHWKSIPVANTVVHYRAQSFIDKDGKNVFHVEEVQSDPHQKARDVRKDEIKKRVENEKDRRFRKLAQQLDDDPDFLPEGYDFYSINESGEMGGETGIGIFNTKTGKDLGSIEGTDDDDRAAKRLKKKFISQLRTALKNQVDLSDDEIKAIAKEVPEDFGYKTSEKEAKAKEIEDKIRQIRDKGLSVDELEEYFQPGKIVKSWAGTDKVLGFTRGPKPGSDEWQQEYNKALAYVRQNYLLRNDDDYYDMATNIANNKANEWQVQVVEIDPATSKEIGSPRIHRTSPVENIIKELRQQRSDLGGVISDLPYKKTYDELALKQIIDDAVNQGYDRVSISPGLFQVDRYQSAIRSKIDSIEYGPMTDNGRLVSFMKNGRAISDVVVGENGKVRHGPPEWQGEPLKNIIGEDMANKIIAAPERGQLSGENLTVGAKGFVEFYDKRLPNFLREYLRKEFGADTGRTEFEYDIGKREKSFPEITAEVRNKFLNDELTQDQLDALMEFEQDFFFDYVNDVARAHGLDPDSDDVQMMAFNDEGPFAGIRETMQNYALKKLADEIYDAQPMINPKANVFSFDITPEMSEKVKTQGQRLFAAAPVVALPMAQDDEDKRKVSPSYTIAPEAKTPTLTPQEEQQFQSDVRGTDWFSRFKEKYGEEPNLEDKEYNYRAAWKSGARPQAIEQDDIPHWPSVTSSGESLKARSHPSGWMEDYMQITGRDPSEGGDLTPEQTDAMNKSLMYRYGFAGGGRADKMKQVLKKMGVDESKVADKDLVTLQDFHTSLGDSIRERAAKMQQQMDAMEFKYKPGQHVFTESSARKNLPPLKILRRTMVGNQPMREPHPDHPLMGKVVKDPETGKTLRTPYEPGYMVRHERSDGWAEYDIPESAIKGSIDEFAKGGLAKKIRELRQKISDESGEYNAKRLDRAADEVKNLETIYSPEALRRAFMGDNTTGLAVISPSDFQKYAAALSKRGYDAFEHGGESYKIGDKTVDYATYIKYLESIAKTKGFSDVPFLEINKSTKDKEPWLTLTKETPYYIAGHEGRHRTRALEKMQQPSGLVQIIPRSSIREPIERRTKEQGVEGLKKEIQGKRVVREDAMADPEKYTKEEAIIILPEIFKHGGSV